MTRDAVLVELRYLRLEMRGISPKVSTYAKLQLREAELLSFLGTEPGNSLMRADRQMKKDRISKEVIQATAKRCIEKGCSNVGEVRGGRKQVTKYGIKKRFQYCARHRRINAKQP